MVENKDPMAKAIDTLKPILTKLTFGSLMGYCSGYATKRIGKAAAFAVGVSFMVMQGLVSTGYINIDWGKVKDDAIKSVDTVSSLLIFDCMYWFVSFQWNWFLRHAWSFSYIRTATAHSEQTTWRSIGVDSRKLCSTRCPTLGASPLDSCMELDMDKT